MICGGTISGNCAIGRPLQRDQAAEHGDDGDDDRDDRAGG